MTLDERLRAKIAEIEKGGVAKYHAKNKEVGKRFARDRIGLLLDPGSFVEDAKLANNVEDDLPSDGVITGLGKLDDRLVAVMANDSTVKAGSWGRLTGGKILRIQEQARLLRCAPFYLVDSPGAPLTAPVEMFPPRRVAV